MQDIGQEDKDLYRNFLNGDEEAFETIVDKYAEKLIYFIFGFVKDIEVAKDLSQDVFVYIYTKKKDYDFKYSLKTYLFVIGKSRAKNYLKKESKNVKLVDEVLYRSELLVDIEEEVLKNINKEKLRDIILNFKNGIILYLIDIEELSYEETAKVLGKTVGQIRNQLYRLRKKLKENLLKEEERYVW